MDINRENEISARLNDPKFSFKSLNFKFYTPHPTVNNLNKYGRILGFLHYPLRKFYRLSSMTLVFYGLEIYKKGINGMKIC